jgi:hypothetical protein
MARQIVEDHGVALVQNGDENLLDVGEETLGVDRPVEHKGCNQPPRRSGRQETSSSSNDRSGHSRWRVRRHRPRRNGASSRSSSRSRRGKSAGRQGSSARSATLPGAQRRRDDAVRWRARFFLKLIPSAAKNRDSIDLSATTPCARSRRRRSHRASDRSPCAVVPGASPGAASAQNAGPRRFVIRPAILTP